MIALFVIARIVANPVSNVFQKQLAQRSANPIFIIGATHALLTLACLPFIFNSMSLSAEFWMNIVLCALLAVLANTVLVFALHAGDLSVLGPINAYKSVISMLLGVFLLGELPTPMGVAGVILIITGSYFIFDRVGGQSRGIQLRFLAMALSATEAVFLKKAILLSSPLTTFVFWSVLGTPIAAAALRGRIGNELALCRREWKTYLWLALTTGLMQLTTLLTFGKLQVGYSLALFQLSSLISVLLGYRYFQESNIRKRLIGSMIMIAGAALIIGNI